MPAQSLREALVSLLRTNCTNAGVRIGPWKSMQTAACPRITYKRISNKRLYVLKWGQKG